MIQVFSGRFVDLENPQEENIHIEDIAHSLSQLCRYTGHTREFFSVAQHSVLASYIAERIYLDLDLAYSMLFHDTHEAYLGDMSSPLKRLVNGKYFKLGETFDKVIASKFNVDLWHPLIDEIDKRLCITEAKELMNVSEGDFWHDAEPYDIDIIPWTPKQSKYAFLASYEFLKYHV